MGFTPSDFLPELELLKYSVHFWHYPDSVVIFTRVTDHVVEERIKLLEEEVLRMRENQERILQERVEAEVQQRLEQEVSRVRQQSDDRFKSMEERWSRMMGEMVLSSRSSSNPTLPNRDTPNA